MFLLLPLCIKNSINNALCNVDDARGAGDTKPSVANWPRPVSMIEAVGDRDKERHLRVLEELAGMTREDRLRKRFESMVYVLTHSLLLCSIDSLGIHLIRRKWLWMIR